MNVTELVTSMLTTFKRLLQFSRYTSLRYSTGPKVIHEECAPNFFECQEKPRMFLYRQTLTLLVEHPGLLGHIWGLNWPAIEKNAIPDSGLRPKAENGASIEVLWNDPNRRDHRAEAEATLCWQTLEYSTPHYSPHCLFRIVFKTRTNQVISFVQ